MERTASRLRDAVAREGSFVLGFYGATVDGAIAFPAWRGDITGAIVARCLDAGLVKTDRCFRFFRLTHISLNIHVPLDVLPLMRCVSFPMGARSCRKNLSGTRGKHSIQIKNTNSPLMVPLFARRQTAMSASTLLRVLLIEKTLRPSY